MNSKVMHSYIMRQKLNSEYSIYREFLRKYGFKSKKFDSVVLISGEKKEDATEW